jgi:hypothetical protein
MRNATTPVPYRRRKILVDPAYQLRVAGLVLLAILFYAGLLGFLLFYPLMLEFEAAADSPQQLWLATQVLDLHKRVWPGVLVVGILVAVQSLFVTHRIVGPSYHLRRVIEGLCEGKVAMRAHLRRFDRLKDLEAALNALGERLQEREDSRAGRDTALRAAVTALADGAPGSLPPAMRQAVEELERITEAPAAGRRLQRGDRTE